VCDHRVDGIPAAGPVRRLPEHIAQPPEDEIDTPRSLDGDRLVVADPEVRTEPKPARIRRYPRLKVAATVLIVAVLAAEVVLVGPHIAQAGRSLRHLDVRWLLLACAAEGASMAMFARLQRRMVTAGGVRIPVRRMIGVTYAANAMSVTLPAGQLASSAYFFRRLRGWGARGSLVTFAMVASALLSTLALLVILIAGATFAGDSTTDTVLLAAEVIAAIIATIGLRRVMRRPDFLLRVGNLGLNWTFRLLRRPADTGRARLSEVITEFSLIRPRYRDWLLGLLFAMLNWAFDLLCLVAACRAVGAHGPSLDVALVTYAAAMTASSVPLLPGGLGLVDGVLILALVRGGLSAGSATAGVLIYRLISLGVVSLIGWLLWVFVDRTGRRAPAQRPSGPPAAPNR
jgi:uncharacterized protein (TIRG00374 family)